MVLDGDIKERAQSSTLLHDLPVFGFYNLPKTKSYVGKKQQNLVWEDIFYTFPPPFFFSYRPPYMSTFCCNFLGLMWLFD
jgi:hypothetical protein